MSVLLLAGEGVCYGMHGGQNKTEQETAGEANGREESGAASLAA